MKTLQSLYEKSNNPTKGLKYKIVNSDNPRNMRLQSIGLVLGTPSGEIKKGDYLMWNWGSITEVVEIVSETNSFVTIKEKSMSSDYVGNRRLGKTRLVCILYR